MKMKLNNKLTIKYIVIVFIVLIVVSIVLVLKNIYKTFPGFIDLPMKNQVNNVNTHTSQDLKISFQYPKLWYIDDRYHIILLTNFRTNQNQNDSPNSNQIEVTINNANLCQKTIDEEIIKGGCGEANGASTKILEKHMQELASGVFYVYKIKDPQEKQQIWYYLQNGDRILQISKEPDPSQFEKEFMNIINSITFL